jgi:hypothetical protein
VRIALVSLISARTFALVAVTRTDPLVCADNATETKTARHARRTGFMA